MKKGKKPKRRKASLQQRRFGVNEDNSLKRRRIINDRRRFMPERDDHARYEDGRRVHYTSADAISDEYGSQLKRHITGRTAFINSKNVTICKRRKTRRRILFKLKRIGKGTSGVARRRVYNEFSRIVCRRK